MAESVTFENGKCSRNRNENMAEFDSPEIREESPRSLPQQQPNDSVAAETEVETPPAQPQQQPNDSVAAETEVETPPVEPQQQPNDSVSAETEVETSPAQPQRIDSELLRAIVNGDLMLFKSILEKEGEPTDIESIGDCSGGNNGLRGVAYGENTALHVVAGAMEKCSQIPIFKIFLYSLVVVTTFFNGIFHGIGLIPILIQIFLLLCYIITKFKIFLFPLGVVTFYFYGLNNWIVIPIFLLLCYIIRNKVKKIVNVHFPWIPQNIYNKAKSIRCLKWVLFLFFHKRRMYEEIAKFIYNKHKPMLNALNYAKETPLHCAANSGNLHMVSLLLEFACEEGPQKLKEVLRAKNEVGETALHEAARSGHSGVVKELLSADEKLASSVDENLASSVDNNGISPLYWAVTTGCLDVIQQLIAAEHPPSYAGPDTQNALHAAVMRQKENITPVILEKNSLLAAQADEAGNTPLHYAAFIGNIYAVRKLLQLKDTGPVYKGNSSGSFPVHLAAEAGNAKVIKELLNRCPDVGELLDKEEKNFLHVAVEKKRIGVIMLAGRERISAKVLNAKDKDGNTPLHLAVKISESEIVDLLSRNKRVNLNIRNKAGHTPLDTSTSLQDHQFKYSPNPQSIIHGDLLRRGAIQSPCHPNPSEIVDNPVEMDNGASVDTDPRQRKRKDKWNGVGDMIEKESTKYENMSKSLITGAVLIASATFAAIFTLFGLGNRGDNPRDYDTWVNKTNIFIAFVIADVAAFLCAILSTIGLLYSALSDIHLKCRKLYFQLSTPLLYIAICLFILAFGLGVCFAIESSRISTSFSIIKPTLAAGIFWISVGVIMLIIMFSPYVVSHHLLHRYYHYKNSYARVTVKVLISVGIFVAILTIVIRGSWLDE